jgi:hypothetical protein
MEDGARNYKNLQNSWFHSACPLVGVRETGVLLLWFIVN